MRFRLSCLDCLEKTEPRALAPVRERVSTSPSPQRIPFTLSWPVDKRSTCGCRFGCGGSTSCWVVGWGAWRGTGNRSCGSRAFTEGKGEALAPPPPSLRPVPPRTILFFLYCNVSILEFSREERLHFFNVYDQLVSFFGFFVWFVSFLGVVGFLNDRALVRVDIIDE